MQSVKSFQDQYSRLAFGAVEPAAYRLEYDGTRVYIYVILIAGVVKASCA